MIKIWNQIFQSYIYHTTWCFLFCLRYKTAPPSAPGSAPRCKYADMLCGVSVLIQYILFGSERRAGNETRRGGWAERALTHQLQGELQTLSRDAETRVGGAWTAEDSGRWCQRCQQVPDTECAGKHRFLVKFVFMDQISGFAFVWWRICLYHLSSDWSLTQTQTTHFQLTGSFKQKDRTAQTSLILK